MATCGKCKDGVIETGSNDLPCDCPLGDAVTFTERIRGGTRMLTGAEIKAEDLRPRRLTPEDERTLREDIAVWAERDLMFGAILARLFATLDAERSAQGQAIVRIFSRLRASCPCLYTKPCSEGCSCAKPVSSAGCARCCAYGPIEQRQTAAAAIAAAMDRGAPETVSGAGQ